MSEINKLGQNFSMGSMVKFTLPSIIMMIFMSLYTSVDGAFVARLISEKALGAVNIIYPIFSIVFAISLMFATGGNAIIAKKLGEGKKQEAREFFTVIYLLGFVFGIIIIAGFYLFENQILNILEAKGSIFENYAKDYGRTLILFAPMCFMQMFAQNFFVTEGKPKLSLIVGIIGGISNMILDYVFIAKFGFGIKGAALATGVSYCIPGLYSIYYFSRATRIGLKFVKPKWNIKEILDSMFNGSSELVNNLSLAVTTFIFNKTMLTYVGENGVAAITVILYLEFIQAALYFGFAQGVSPIISYKYGERNKEQLKVVIKNSIIFMIMSSLGIVIVSNLLSDYAISLFIDKSSIIFDITKEGFIIFSIAYLFMGTNVFLSAMFTAFGNGKISALLSFLRTFVFISSCLIILPQFFGVIGIWIAVPVAEFLAVCIGLFLFSKYKKGYLGK